MQKARVGDVQQNNRGPGFVIYDDAGKPRLAMTYSNEREAKAAHGLVVAALANAAYATGLRG